jgi:uncharacterized phiE125 gp8 family phage protein
MKLTLVTPPSAEPVTLPEARLQLRLYATGSLENIAEDAYIAGLITAARDYVENVTGRALVTQTWDVFFDRWPWGDAITLPKAPLQSVTSLTYYDTDRTAATLTEGTEFTVDTDSAPGRIVLENGEIWPTTQLHPNNPIKIRFVAGYLDTSSPPDTVAGVPANIKHAIKLLVTHWYGQRTPTGDVVASIPWGVDALLAPYRMWRY